MVGKNSPKMSGINELKFKNKIPRFSLFPLEIHVLEPTQSPAAHSPTGLLGASDVPHPAKPDIAACRQTLGEEKSEHRPRLNFRIRCAWDFCVDGLCKYPQKQARTSSEMFAVCFQRQAADRGWGAIAMDRRLARLGLQI